MSGRFNPNEYEPVEDRIRRFWADHPAGRILTELVHRDERQYIFRAEVFADADDQRPSASGYAEEIIGGSPVNKTNALENAETSAIGRALANLNYSPKGARPSREEMQKSTRPAAQSNGQSPAQRAKTAVDAVLTAADEPAAAKVHDRVIASPIKDTDVSGLLTQDDRETLGINQGEPLQLWALAALVTDYVANHKRPVREPVAA